MQKIKRLDWLEFTFPPSENFDVPAGYSMQLVGEKYLNNDMHTVNHIVTDNPDLSQFPHVVYQSLSRGKYLVQWTGSTIPYDPRHELRKLASFFGIPLSEITIKRIDIAFDLAEPMPAIDRSLCQCRCKSYGSFNSNGQTHYFGRSPLRLRIYDKAAELSAKREDKALAYLAMSGLDPDQPITRVEFELRSQALRKRGISTAEQFLEKLPDLESYLVREWFWIPKNRSKKTQEFSSFWQAVVDLTQETYHLTAIPKESADCEKLLRTGFSVLASAYVGKLPEGLSGTPEAFQEFVMEKLLEFKPLNESWRDFFGRKV